MSNFTTDIGIFYSFSILFLNYRDNIQLFVFEFVPLKIPHNPPNFNTKQPERSKFDDERQLYL